MDLNLSENSNSGEEEIKSSGPQPNALQESQSSPTNE